MLQENIQIEQKEDSVIFTRQQPIRFSSLYFTEQSIHTFNSNQNLYFIEQWRCVSRPCRSSDCWKYLQNNLPSKIGPESPCHTTTGVFSFAQFAFSISHLRCSYLEKKHFERPLLRGWIVSRVWSSGLFLQGAPQFISSQVYTFMQNLWLSIQ